MGVCLNSQLVGVFPSLRLVTRHGGSHTAQWRDTLEEGSKYTIEDWFEHCNVNNVKSFLKRTIFRPTDDTLHVDSEGYERIKRSGLWHSTQAPSTEQSHSHMAHTHRLYLQIIGLLTTAC